MPTTESSVHSRGCPAEYDLKRGGTVTLRNGCIFRGNELVASNGQAVDWLRKNAVLSADQAYWLDAVIQANSIPSVNMLRARHRRMPGLPPKHGGPIND